MGKGFGEGIDVHSHAFFVQGFTINGVPVLLKDKCAFDSEALRIFFSKYIPGMRAFSLP
jgi:hypothetical protein